MASGRHVIIIVDMVGFCEVEKMGKDYKVKEIDLSGVKFIPGKYYYCLLYTSPSPRDGATSRMPSSA